MKIKNSEIGKMLMSMDNLKGLSLEGDITLAAVRLKKQLIQRNSEIEEAKESVIKNYCLKDILGSPIKSIKEQGGQQYALFSFENDEQSALCAGELNKINEEETDISDYGIHMDRIIKIKCSVEQMEVLLLLTPNI